MKRCWKCGREWIEKHTPGTRDECEGCLSPWHACRNCRFFRDDARQWCGEPQARDQKPRDPEMGNTCEYFQLRDETGGPAPAGGAGKDIPAWARPEPDAKPDLEKIFKPPDPE